MSGKRLLKDSTWSIAATLLARISGAAVLMISARWFTGFDFGELALVQATAISGGSFIGLGCGVAATASVARSLSRDKSRIAAELMWLSLLTVGTASIIGTTVACFRRPLAEMILKSPQHEDYFLVAALLIVASASSLCLSGMLAGFRAFRLIALCNAISGCGAVLMVSASVWFGSVFGVLVSLLVAAACSVLTTLCSVLWCCRNHGVVLRFGRFWEVRNSALKLATPAVLLNGVNSPTDYFAFALLAQQVGGVSETGTYYVLNQWCLLLRFAPLAASAVIMPSLTASSGSERVRLLSLYLRRGVLAALVVSFVAAVALAVAGPWLLASHGPNFTSRWPLLCCLLVSGVAIAVQIVAERVLLGLGYLWTAFGLSASRGIAFCLLAPLAIQGGADGLALDRCLTFTAAAIVTVLACVAVGRADTTNSLSAEPMIRVASPTPKRSAA